MGEFNIAQCLMNQGTHSTDEIQELMHKAEADGAALARLITDDLAIDPRPVHTAVERAAGGAWNDDLELYSDYMELFLDSLSKFMHTEAVVSPVRAEDVVEGEGRASSQCIGGDVSLVAGLVASDRVFLELARRYSQEELPEIDELAVDSLEEFLNVVNGIYTVELARRKIDAELGLPRSGEDVQPHSSRQLCLRICTAFGSFRVVLAVDEFI